MAYGNITCTPNINYTQNLNCTYRISSNLVKYVVIIAYGNGNTSSIQNATDGTFSFSYNYPLYGNYTVSIYIPFIGFTVSQANVTVNPGFIVFTFEIIDCVIM